MHRYMLPLLLTMACVPTAPPKPPAEPLQAQLATRVGFMLDQLEQRDAQIKGLRGEVARLQRETAENITDRSAAELALGQSQLEVGRLKAVIAERDELLALRSRQIVKAFSEGAGNAREVETLTHERDTCYVQLAEAMIPLRSAKTP